MNVDYGFILCNNETGVLQYYYASRNNNYLFDSLFQIVTAADLQQVHQTFKDADILDKIPGSAYKPTLSIFQFLEDEGFTIPQHVKYFPYRATFDFQCMS